MATYNDDILNVIRTRLVPKMQAVSLEIAAIEPYSYAGQDLLSLRKEFEYYTMIYDFLSEYAIGTEQLDNDKLTNIVRLIEVPDSERKLSNSTLRIPIQKYKRAASNYKLFIDGAEFTPDLVFDGGTTVSIRIEYTPARQIVEAKSMDVTIDTTYYINGSFIYIADYYIPTSYSGTEINFTARAASDGVYLDAGEIWSIWIREVSVEIPAIPVALDPLAIVSTSFIALWELADRATGYYLDVSSDIDFNSYETFNASSTSYTVIGKTPNTTYYYRVRAYNSVGTSDNSNVISLLTTVILENGYLYNWFTVNDPRNMAPVGFHVPTYNELVALRNYCGDAGSGPVKEVGTTHWDDPNTGATNTTGLSLYGSGYRNPSDGSFGDLKQYGYIWSSEEDSPGNGIYAMADYNSDIFGIGDTYTREGFSVRYIKDETLGVKYGRLYNWYAASKANMFDDWFIPSLGELSQLFYHQQGNEWYQDGLVYTCSTEVAAGYIRGIVFITGATTSKSKTETCDTIPCRKFISSKEYYIHDVGPAGGWIFIKEDNLDGSYTYYEASFASEYRIMTNVTTASGATGTAIGTGQSNCNLYLAQAGINDGAVLFADNLEYEHGSAIAPSGWHVPTQVECETLFTTLGGAVIAGGHLKESGLTHWLTPNTGADNSSGFTALPAGLREFDGSFFGSITINADFWSATDSEGLAWIWACLNDFADIFSGPVSYQVGLSIRCVKDSTILTNGQSSTVTDIDANIYPTICIGAQEWMAENLRVTKYNDSAPIPIITDNALWAADTTGAMCTYNNLPLAIPFESGDTVTGNDGKMYDLVDIGGQVWTKQNSAETKYQSGGLGYGYLYNYYAVSDSRNMAPAGWHVMTIDDLNALTGILGGQYVAGGKLKETGFTHWSNPNIDAADSISFAGVGNGARGDSTGAFHSLGTMGGIWTDYYEYTEGFALARMLMYNDGPDISTPYIYNFGQNRGYGVRLFKDYTKYQDWYVPTIGDMENIYTLSLSMPEIIGDGYYWSSSELDATNAQMVQKNPLSLDSDIKTAIHKVRLMREFMSDIVYNIGDIGPAGGWIFASVENMYYELAPFDAPDYLWDTSGTLLGTSTGAFDGLTNATLIYGPSWPNIIRPNADYFFTYTYSAPAVSVTGNDGTIYNTAAIATETYLEAPTNITITPDAVGANPYTMYYRVIQMNDTNQYRGNQSDEIEITVGDDTTSFTFTCDVNDVNNWIAGYVIFWGDTTGNYPNGYVIWPNEFGTPILISAYDNNAYEWFLAAFIPYRFPALCFTTKNSIETKYRSARKIEYGALYNWWAATYNNNGVTICPPGWHIITVAEWTALSSYLGANGYQKICEAGNIHWNLAAISGATNSTGFTALPGGGRQGQSGGFDTLGDYFFYWSDAVGDGEHHGWTLNPNIPYPNLGYVGQPANCGYSVRGVKNSTTLTEGQTGTVTDFDGNIYPTVCINGLEWMASNLAVTKYNDGTDIPIVTDNTAWANLGVDIDTSGVTTSSSTGVETWTFGHCFPVITPSKLETITIKDNAYISKTGSPDFNIRMSIYNTALYPNGGVNNIPTTEIINTNSINTVHSSLWGEGDNTFTFDSIDLPVGIHAFVFKYEDIVLNNSGNKIKHGYGNSQDIATVFVYRVGTNWLPLSGSVMPMVITFRPDAMCYYDNDINYAYTDNDNIPIVTGNDAWGHLTTGARCSYDNLEYYATDGDDLIPEVTDPTAWTTLTTGARCSYNNDETNAIL